LSIEGLKEERRIEQISKLFVESPSKSTAFFANPIVVYNLSKIYYDNKEYNNAISTGNQFLTRSEDKTKQSEIVKIIARSEFEKIENEMAELSPAESLKEAKVYIQNLNYNPAIVLLEPLANRNNSEAQYLLGTLYYNGTGVAKDVAKAADLFAKAAQDNNVDAQLKLGIIYLEGVGVTKSLTNSRFWLEQASENKHPSAAAALDNLSSEEKAASRAADKKKKEDEKKIEDAKKEADKKLEEEANIKEKEEVILEVVEDVKDEDIKGTDAEIIAMTLIKASSYYKGGLLTDAFNNYLIAAKKGNPVAQERIGWMYFKGKGVKKDKDLGIDWWKKAAQKGNGDAISYLTRLGEW
jgi:TPR repeat protein